MVHCDDRHWTIQTAVDTSSSCDTTEGEENVDIALYCYFHNFMILQVMAKRYVMSEEMKNEILPSLQKATNMHVYANKVFN